MKFQLLKLPLELGSSYPVNVTKNCVIVTTTTSTDTDTDARVKICLLKQITV